VSDGLLLSTTIRTCEQGRASLSEGKTEKQTCRIRKAQRRSTVLTTKHLPTLTGLPVKEDSGATSSTRLNGPEVDKVETERKSSIESEFNAMRPKFGGSSAGRFYQPERE